MVMIATAVTDTLAPTTVAECPRASRARDKRGTTPPMAIAAAVTEAKIATSTGFVFRSVIKGF
ncbi:MAG: hypothetical protein A2516_08235 [Alphaproteobacteria bacterium RIFOXYD12_FULL_60_8]|nr:MAG: hypothetical protein A2516_08235 [Alphaproteobacteria bacterium RIFOXYD12_FULL_60_8]